MLAALAAFGARAARADRRRPPRRSPASSLIGADRRLRRDVQRRRATRWSPTSCRPDRREAGYASRPRREQPRRLRSARRSAALLLLGNAWSRLVHRRVRAEPASRWWSPVASCRARGARAGRAAASAARSPSCAATTRFCSSSARRCSRAMTYVAFDSLLPISLVDLARDRAGRCGDSS